ncbi:MAG TPA: hypothetical protein PLI34_01925, partial [Saprospiraceae bacterium]|nr:hypothetical protein [Saprospiraceae bacterium]
MINFFLHDKQQFGWRRKYRDFGNYLAISKYHKLQGIGFELVFLWKNLIFPLEVTTQPVPPSYDHAEAWHEL